MEAGFIWSDLLTNLERTSDHCSNVAVCILDSSDHNMNIHASMRSMKKNNPQFEDNYREFSEKYGISHQYCMQ